MKIFKKLPLLAVLIMILILCTAAAGVAAEKEGESPPAATEPQLKSLFSDVAANDNNALFINYLADRKIITGYPDGSYHPQEGLTRAQAAVVLVKAANLNAPAVTDTGFTDVKAEHWAAASIAAAAKAGYLKGYPDGSFHPDEKLTRAQGVAMVMRLSTRQERPQLPELKDLDQSHWAAGDMALALATGMIGLTNNNTQINLDLAMSRGSLARALGTLLTKDPGLYLQKMAGTIKNVKGEVKLTRQGASNLLQNDDQVYAGDAISSTANSSASIYYPDGSSVLIKENTEIVVRESIGRNCIKSDGSSGVAVDNVDFDLKKGTLFGALAAKQGAEEKQQARASEKLLASINGLDYIADTGSKTPPWYQQAQAKKVKMKVDMPYGVASVRGTFILVSVLPDGTATVGCLTGDADVSGTSGKYTALAAGLSSAVAKDGTTTNAAPMSAKEKEEFNAAQQWVVNTALGIDKNKESTAPPVMEMLVEIPGQVPAPAQQVRSVKNTIEVVLNALDSSGIKLTEQVKKDLEQKLKEIQSETSTKIRDVLKDENDQTKDQSNNGQSGGGGGSDEGSSGAYIHYAAAGTYGPESSANTRSVNKNVIIGASGVTLQNTVINRDLILAASIGEGSVTLKNVKVLGNTFVLGGGPNSVVLEDCELYTVTVDKETNIVRIVAKGNTAVGALTLNSGAKLEESNISSSGFSSVTTGPSIPAGAQVILSGNFAAVSIESPGLKIDVAGGSIGEINLSSAASGVALNLGSGVSISSLQVNAPVEIKGSGQIVSAVIKSPGVVIEKQPLSWTVVGDNITATIGNQSVSGSGGVSTNAKLATLSLSRGTLDPVFAPTTYNYSASVANSVYSVTVGFSCQDANSSVLFNNAPVAGGESSKTVSLNEGESNAITIKVTAQDGSTTATYTVTVTRGPNSLPVANAVSISGTAQVGQTLIGQYTYSDADDDPEGTPICKWYRADAETGPKTVLDVVYNSLTYTATNEDADKYLFFEVTPVASSGVSPGSPACSNGVLVAVPNTAPTTPVITKTPLGVVTVNDTVTFTAVSTDAEGDQINYVWKVDNNLPTETGPEAGKYAAGSHTVTVKARDEHGLESQPATMMFNVYDNATGDGGLTLTSAHSRLYANIIEGATITGYSFNVPKVNGHMSPKDYGEVRGLTVDGNWEVLDHKATTNGVSFTRNETSGKCSYMTYTYYVGENWVDNEATAARDMSPGKYRCLEFYYYTDHQCMYNKSNITFSVNYVLGSTPSTALPEAVPAASNVTISGTPAAGHALTASYNYSDSNNDLEGIATYGTTSSFNTGVSYYQWYRADDPDGTVNKTPIGTATKSYTVTNNDAGKYIFFEVTPSSLTGTTRTGTAATSAGTQIQIPLN